ncbi:MAG: hypothetical protein GF384_09165 [Elusimicrobia bacterium]|nr:hypothetical protein [Elusimicrobiota bacterium]MBD3412753.1 hypothetical protein [Elusimicrobiota bacterium]
MSIEQFCRLIKEKIPESCPYEWEIFIAQRTHAAVVWANGSVEEKKHAQSRGIGIRLVSNGRQGFASSSGFDINRFDEVWQAAATAIRFMPADPLRMVPEVSRIAAQDVMIFDPDIDRMDLRGREEMLNELEKKLLAFDTRIRKAYRLEWSQSTGISVLMTSKGMEISKRGTGCAAGIECIAEDRGDTQVGGFGLSSRFISDLKTDDLPARSGQLALDQLNGKPINSGHLPVIFEPWVMVEFLGLIASSVCADSVQKGKSMFAGRLGQPVASSQVSITDNGILPRGLGSANVDGEGMPRQRTVIIEHGVLKAFLYDTYTARKDKTHSTGNATRASFRGVPEPGYSNFILEPGLLKRNSMIQNITKGVRIINIMGMHTADPISGDFSLGAVGTMIENGRFTRPVKGITIAGNLHQMLHDIVGICDDAMMLGDISSPTVMVNKLMIGGS